MKHIWQNKSYYSRIIGLYVRYQLLTKGLLFFVVFPLSRLVTQWLLGMTGRTNLSSGDFKSFLISPQGVGLLVLGLCLLVILVAMDINAFIVVSSLIREKRIKLTARQVLKVSLLSMKSFMKPSGLVILVYVALVVPLVGIGLTVGPLESFKIPNFITDVIFKSPLYSSLYFGTLAILFVITFRYFFVFHYLLLGGLEVPEALTKAKGLMGIYWKRFIKDFFLHNLGYFVAMGAVVFALFMLLILPIEWYHLGPGWTMFGLLYIVEVLSAFSFLTIPIICHRATVLFYRYNELEGTAVEGKLAIAADYVTDEPQQMARSTKMMWGLLFFGMTLVNIGLASVYGYLYKDVFSQGKAIEIVAHRGGGDLAAENTIASLEAAIKASAAWSEIDVQRTKDGAYIINHDATFKRVSGLDQAPMDLTLAEIKELSVQDLFDESRPSYPVATLEEFLDAAKGKIGLYIELKGASADHQMVDDLVKMIEEKGMASQVALLSLDYSLIQYIEETHPSMTSGYLYYFALGELADLQGDILIMEEREATPDKIAEIHAAGKKAVVWTVNTDASIDTFVKSEVDGIITDYVLKVKEGMKARDSRSQLEIVLDDLLGFK